MRPWWLCFTREERFWRRHQGCNITKHEGRNWAGYYVLYTCDDLSKGWSHHMYTLGYDTTPW
jgi:hypothetical protein